MTGAPPLADAVDVRRPAVVAWLEQHVPGSAGPYASTVITGGRSNVTARVTGTHGPAVVLRRPPAGHLAATAHDVLREHRIYAALQGTGVPVPETYGACADDAVLGAPFFAMAYLEGSVLGDVPAADAYPVAAKPALADAVVDAMVALHAVDPDAVGLGDLSKREDYLDRQLRRWHRQYADSPDADLELLDGLWRRLSASPPPQRRTGVVHGDLRLGNVLAAADGRVLGVLDWELTALGDVLADLGWLLSTWAEEGEEVTSPMQASASPGFPSRDHVAQRYAAATGSDLADIPWYVAFAHWRSAAISVGIVDRARQRGADDAAVAERLGMIASAAARGQAVLDTGTLR